MADTTKNLDKIANKNYWWGTYVTDLFLDSYSITRSDSFKAYSYGLAIYDTSNPDHVEYLGLPIAPTNISINVPGAVNLSVTMKGIVEEHNGSPIRTISVRGTSGVLSVPNGSGPGSGGPANLVQAMFKNTIKQFNDVVGSAKSTFKTFASLAGSGAREEPLNTITPKGNELTGYIFTHRLANFLDRYMSLKKQKQHKNVRLQFLMWKDHMYYDCTLNGYSIQKVAGTLEYEYSLQLTAWRRNVNPATKNTGANFSRRATQAKDLNSLAKGLDALRKSRRLISKSVGLLNGIRSDLDQSFLGPFKEVSMIVGELVGAVRQVIDFPNALINNLKQGISEAIRSAKVASVSPAKWAKLGLDLKSEGSYATTTVVSSAMAYNSQDALDSLVSETDGATTIAAEGSSPIDTIFNDQINNQTFFEAFTVDDIKVTPEIQSKIDAEVNRVMALTADELKQRQQTVREYIESISAGLGGSSPTYNRTMGLPVKKTYKKLTTEDIVLLSTLNDLSMQLDSVVRYIIEQKEAETNDYFAYYASMAQASDIQFQDSSSKFFVPFPYGASLEALAVQYLGQTDRWIEIAAINGLKAPYIDEDGFYVNFKSSGSGTSAMFDSPENLYVGQIVQLMSDTQPTSIRKISKIDQLNAIDTVITFEGTETIGRYMIGDRAKMRAFMPNTVNSFRLVAIPSNSVVSDTNLMKTSPTLEDLDSLSAMAKRDFLLTEAGDLALTSSGELKIASGMANLQQAAMLKLRTRLGSILTDPTFGNSVSEGLNTAEVDAGGVLAQLEKMFQDDPRFTGVLGSQIKKDGNTLQVDLMLGVKGSDYNLPLSTQMPL